jgi:hypothetical protein
MGRARHSRISESRDFHNGKTSLNPGLFTPSLPSVAVPDRAGRAEVQAFAPNGLRPALAVDTDPEIIAKGKAEAVGVNVVIARHVAGNSGLG